MGEHITVGVDGSAAGTAALEWALDEGIRSGYRVHVVTVCHPGEPEDPELARAVETEIFARPEASVWRRLLVGSPGPELVRVASDSVLLVVGSCGTGGLLATLLGSVSAHCVRHARCPVVVVPAGESAVPSLASSAQGAVR
ncbi:universal stress protein [Actinokineospora auranticolor]|uniref:Nucleotide-binding universal stress UspA family protein n=1 Tax=Actinokineospora auranticolor TaxID=155976 RepID=A0A2S6GPV5_9PSEU|nr:universal stress protein [Actinokineospora auranticolor]PPK67249.1 nucleotide-binding universal stress UspA family protein [Actinokineospora auranticolor]